MAEVLKNDESRSVMERVDFPIQSVMDIKANMHKSQFQIGDNSISDCDSSGTFSPGFGRA